MSSLGTKLDRIERAVGEAASAELDSVSTSVRTARDRALWEAIRSVLPSQEDDQIARRELYELMQREISEEIERRWPRSGREQAENCRYIRRATRERTSAADIRKGLGVILFPDSMEDLLQWVVTIDKHVLARHVGQATADRVTANVSQVVEEGLDKLFPARKKQRSKRGF